MTDGFRMKRISPRRFRRKFRRELEKMGGPLNTPGVTPNLLIDEARQKVAEDPRPAPAWTRGTARPWSSSTNGAASIRCWRWSPAAATTKPETPHARRRV